MTVPNGRRWEERFDKLVVRLQWGTYALGAFVSFAGLGASPRVIAAAVLALATVGLHLAIPARYRNRPGPGEALTVIEVAALMTVIALTGGVDSPYLLLSVTPVLHAGVFFGWRGGIMSALLAGASMLAISYLRSGDPVDAYLMGTISLYLLIGGTFAYARRLLVEADLEASGLSDRERRRLERLDAAHELLTRLSDLADAEDLNPIRVGSTALDHMTGSIPINSAFIAITRGVGATVVASRIDRPGGGERLTVPLRVGHREVGVVTLLRSEPFSEDEERLVVETMQPVALAFANTLLLDEIGQKAVREERARLARELHDDIGPSLASLGLALDSTLLRYSLEPDLVAHLADLRGEVTTLVEDVRSAVGDLRARRLTSLVQYLNELVVAPIQGGPEVIMDVRETALPRPSVTEQIVLVLTEALRNAVLHAGARTIRVEGLVEADHGSISVIDDGKGFDPGEVGRGHYGLIGMRERAHGAGLHLDIESAPGTGTRVAVGWGSEP